jgi:hypothetical protein
MALFEAGGAAAHPPRIHGLRLQQSRTPVVLPVVYGTARVPANIIWFGDWEPFRLQPGTVGKGGPTLQGWAYLMSYMLALCQGPAQQVRQGWASGSSVYNQTPQIIETDWAIGLGAFGQPPWGYFVGNRPGVAIPYTGVCWAAQEWITNPRDYPTMLAESHPQDAMYQYTFEVTALLPFVDAQGNQHLDANPADIIEDFLANPFYGANVPREYIGDLSDFRNYCTAYGLLISPVFDHQQQAGQWLELLLKITNSECRWSSGVLEIIPYTDVAQSGLGVSWTPNLTPVYSLTDDDYIAEKNAAPVQVQRKIPQDRFNNYVIEYTDRANQYRQGMVSVWSDADIATYMLRKAQPRQYLPVMDGGTALTVIQLEMQRSLTVLNTYLFRVDQRYILLEPMDVIAITDSTLGLNNYPVRIVEIVENEDGTLEITAEDLGGNFTPGYALQPHAPANRYSGQLQPMWINPPLLYEPSMLYTQGVLELLIGLSGQNGNQNWAGANIWYSLDGNTYQFYARVTQPANQGFLTAALAAASGTDTTDTLSVALYDDTMTLESVSDSLAQLGMNLCLVDNELIAFATAAVEGAGQYNLTYLIRGLYGSAPAAHAVGAQFTYLGSLTKLDPGIMRLTYSSSMVGKEVYFKFTSFNGEGGIQQSLADVPAYTYTFSGSAVSSPLIQGGPNWVADSAYDAGTVIQAQGFYFIAQNTGTSGSTQPTWPLGVGQTVSDGTVTWVNGGPAPTFSSGAVTEGGSETNSSPPALTSSMVTLVSVSFTRQSTSDPLMISALINLSSATASPMEVQVISQTGEVLTSWNPVPVNTGSAATAVPLTAIVIDLAQGLLGPSVLHLQALIVGGSAVVSSATLSVVDVRH